MALSVILHTVNIIRFCWGNHNKEPMLEVLVVKVVIVEVVIFPQDSRIFLQKKVINVFVWWIIG